jgi:HPt (histidine-containing phosphotransfer) domain-containing protein
MTRIADGSSGSRATSTRLRPAVFAAYSAASARPTSASGVLAALGRPGDADADRHDAALRMRDGEPLDDRAHALAGERRGLERLLGQQHEELLAAVPVHGVAPAHRLGQRGAHAAQQRVALEVPGAVVVALEAVEVEQRDAPAVAVALGPGLHRGEVLGQTVTVAETGQRVLARVAVQAAVQRRHARGAHEHPLELVAAQRLEDDVVGAGLHRAQRLVLVGARGQHDHVRVRDVVLAADAPRQLGAVHPRHLPVGDHDVRRDLGEALPRLRAVLRERALVAEPLDGSGDEQAGARVVVGDEDVHGNAKGGEEEPPRLSAPPSGPLDAAGRLSLCLQAKTADHRGVDPRPAIDPARLRELRDDYGDLAADLLELFEKTAAATLGELRAALDAGDTAELRRLAHRLKGSARNVGATGMAETAAALEQAPADPAARLTSLEAALEPTREQLRAAFEG